MVSRYMLRYANMVYLIGFFRDTPPLFRTFSPLTKMQIIVNEIHIFHLIPNFSYGI